MGEAKACNGMGWDGMESRGEVHAENGEWAEMAVVLESVALLCCKNPTRPPGEVNITLWYELYCTHYDDKW